MTARLAQLFPVLAVAVAVAGAILALRLDRRLSRSAWSAGPVEAERPTPPGQVRTPWELQAIDDQIDLARGSGGSAVPRYDLTATVNRLIAAAGLPGWNRLPVTADLDQLAAAVAAIEERLGLAPLAPAPSDRPHRNPLLPRAPLPGGPSRR